MSGSLKFRIVKQLPDMFHTLKGAMLDKLVVVGNTVMWSLTWNQIDPAGAMNL